MDRKDNTKNGLEIVPLTIYLTQNKKTAIQELAKAQGVNTTRYLTMYFDYGRKVAGKKSLSTIDKELM